jgi:hypothetical protein
MPLTAAVPAIKMKIFTVISTALKKEFAKELAASPSAAESYDKIARAVSEMIPLLLTEIIANADIAPIGIPPFSNSGGPVVGLGKIV